MKKMRESVSSETRITIAHARRDSMAGREREALGRLEEVLREPSLCQIDRTAILLTKAELLYLGGRYKAAHDVFVNELDSLSSELPHSVAIVVGFNRCDVAMAVIDAEGISRFYDLFDEQQIAGIEHWDDSAMLSAAKNAAEGHSYESLPVIWRELLRTYRQGRWAVFRQASRYMAEECIRIGCPQEAAFHAAIALDSNFAKHIGVTLLNSRNAAAVEATIKKLLSTANLQRHFEVACELLQALSDAVPDSLVDQVINWVLLRCANSEEPEGYDAVQGTAWKTVESLAARASVGTAIRVVTVGLGHRAWKARAEKPNQFIPVREEIIDALNQAVGALRIESLSELAHAVIPLATERRNFKDFASAVNLLSHISHRAPDDVRTRIRLALYPPEQPIPPLLMQVASNFGKEVLNKGNQLERYASHVADNIRQVVQRVPKGEEPKPVDGTVMTWTSEKENERLVVHLVSTEDIWALSRHRNQIPAESRHVVITALLEAIRNRDNLLDNRVIFIYSLKGFADCLDAPLAAEVFDVLAPIASGNIELSPDIASAMSQSHPLSRITVKCATVDQVTVLFQRIWHKTPNRVKQQSPHW